MNKKLASSVRLLESRSVGRSVGRSVSRSVGPT